MVNFRVGPEEISSTKVMPYIKTMISSEKIGGRHIFKKSTTGYTAVLAILDILGLKLLKMTNFRVGPENSFSY